MSIDFPDTIDPIEPDDGAGGGGGNRLFIILAVGLTGLIVLGLILIASFVILGRVDDQQAIAQMTSTVTPRIPIIEPSPTFTPTPTATEFVPTETPTTTPTNTPVVQIQQSGSSQVNAPPERAAIQGGGSTQLTRPTSIPTSASAAASSSQTPSEVPNTGVGDFSLGIIALALIAVIYILRRWRHSSTG